jgi:hypothetical protein
LRYSEVRAEQREQGKGKEKVPDSGPSRPQHARPKEPADSEGDEHWIETEKKANVEGDEWVTGKDWEGVVARLDVPFCGRARRNARNLSIYGEFST